MTLIVDIRNFINFKSRNLLFNTGGGQTLHTEVRFASLLSGGFITAIVVHLPERKLAKRTSVHWFTVKHSKAGLEISSHPQN